MQITDLYVHPLPSFAIYLKSGLLWSIENLCTYGTFTSPANLKFHILCLLWLFPFPFLSSCCHPRMTHTFPLGSYKMKTSRYPGGKLCPFLKIWQNGFKYKHEGWYCRFVWGSGLQIKLIEHRCLDKYKKTLCVHILSLSNWRLHIWSEVPALAALLLDAPTWRHSPLRPGRQTAAKTRSVWIRHRPHSIQVEATRCVLPPA